MLNNDYNNLKDKNIKTGLDDYKKWFVVFFDAEGCFIINVRPNHRLEFNITIKLHSDDFRVLEGIINRFQLNTSLHSQMSEDTCSISIGNKDILLNKIIPLFDKYPLLTKNI
jgi:hypothetical protein